MTVPFAIHGFGRVGRALARVARDRPALELRAIGDLYTAADLAPLLARDSIHGRHPGRIVARGDAIEIDGQPVPVHALAADSVTTAASDPPCWSDDGVRFVVEATGTATERERAERHLHAGGAERVLLAAIGDADLMLCRGINDDAYDPAHHRVVSNASCTTNCLALLLRVLDERFGVRGALMNEVHSYTADQALVDDAHPRDLRRGRAAAHNIVPTYSAAADAVERLMPRLAGRVASRAVRVPTPEVALLDLVVTVDPARTLRPTVEAVADAFAEAADGPLSGLLATTDEPLVSRDLVGDPHSAVVDLGMLQTVGDMVRVMAWYDNEWGYAHRLADLLTILGET